MNTNPNQVTGKQEDMRIGNSYEQEGSHISDNFMLIHLTYNTCARL